MQILKISETVKHILLTDAEARESDKMLILKVWAEQNPKLRNKDMRFLDFAKEFLKGNYADTESIRRSAQKLRAEFPELRGSNYKERQKHQAKVKEDLRDDTLNPGATP